jgi:hypothetical protein
MNRLTGPYNPQLIKKIRQRRFSDSNDTGTDYFLSETGAIFRSAVPFDVMTIISVDCIGTPGLQTVSFVSGQINGSDKKTQPQIVHDW